MESEERPSKLRKLSHDANPAASEDVISNGPGSATDPISQVEAATTDATPHPPPNTTNAPQIAEDGTPLSKNQLKKLRRQAQWESGREDRAAKRKVKTAAKKARQRAARDESLASAGMTIADYAKQQALLHPRPVQLPITFLIDCGYDKYMRDGERISLAAQITRAYGENRRAKWRGHVVVSSFGGKLRERFEGVLKGGYRRWKGFRVFEEGFGEVGSRGAEWMAGEEGGALEGPFAREEKVEVASDGEGKAEANVDQESAAATAASQQEGEVVYLSSESENTLTELKPYSTYIVGGLVDKNREKGICYRAACQAGIKTARLPIGEYLEMQSRKVLATNHVVEIMLKWLEYRDWGKAFLEVIPKRKGGALKGFGEAKDGEQEAENEGEGNQDDEATRMQWKRSLKLT
ncbi:hypothetical protein K461DRAFT_319752 [Myriangium duriaei CBS 260.36]|uniref:tRNA (guanine(9)-N1)-methyltransferase n=1 Tax=Myriangium duriaei CBS 260.36 TaxID=1168546 RepID=A0A9P4J8D8_9PEZI|nr:hypothetical protein K461DRAFT_319752 [Myriangium duriaei CBS 260.36]